MKSSSFTNWYTMVFNGIVALLYGILALFIPSSTLLTIVTWFGILIMIVGVIGIIAAFANRRNGRKYVADLIWSSMTFIIGGVLVFYTQRSIEIFFVIIGIWAVLVGIIQLWLVSKIEMDDQVRKIYLINGIVTLIFGIVLLIFPFTAAQALVIISGIFALLSGAMLIYLAIQTKNHVEEIN